MLYTRRGILKLAASSAAVAALLGGCESTDRPKWSEEFATLDLITGSNRSGLWAGSAIMTQMVGSKDPAGNSWNANPNQHLGHGVGVLNPFTVAPVTDSAGHRSHGNALTISCHKCSPPVAEAIAAVNGGATYPRWGGTVVMNGDRKFFTVGSYIETRALFHGGGQGVWPAIWLFASSGVSNRQFNDSGHEGAEIDIVEPMSQINSGPAGFHLREVGDAPNARYQVNGSSDVPTNYNYPIQPDRWARYGLDWQRHAITFYLNGIPVYKETNRTVLAYFNGNVKLAYRLDYTMQPGTDAATNPVSMSVDYIREWPSFAASNH